MSQNTIRAASTYSEVNIQSPNAAALGKYVDLPVSNYTGTPNINIPIYTVKEGPLSLPVSLSYHASGIKVMELASWIGIGWSLNAGGVITRTVRGIADEAFNSGNGDKGYFKDYGYSSYMTDSGPTGPPGLGYGVTGPNDHDFEYGSYDGEPDLYFFNFAGYMGSFYFRDDRTPIIEGGQDLKIEYYYPQDNQSTFSALSANIQGFIITTPDGTKYYFGINATGTSSGSDPIEWTFPFSDSHQNVTDNVFSSWYLNKIESADKNFTINLTYTSESYSYFNVAMFPIDENSNFPDAPKPYELVKTYITGVRLKNITFSNGSIVFTPVSAARTDLSEGFNNVAAFSDNANVEAKGLGSIQISDVSGLCKKYIFYQSYFIDNTTPLPDFSISYSIQTDRKRLRLDSLKEISCDGSGIIPAFKFSYYGTNNFLTRRLSFAQDHWGFYNGRTSNINLIPTYIVDPYKVIQGADREAYWPDMKYGTLTRITYPTGGYDSLEFESHTTWVVATRYDPAFPFSSSIYNMTDNTYPATFSTNHYQLVIQNPNCGGQNACDASVNLKDASGTITYIGNSTPGGKSDTSNFMLTHSGPYTIQMHRNSPDHSATIYTFTELIPNNIQSNVTVGGLRIKSITKNDGLSDAQNVVTSYNYNLNGQSQGVLYSRPSYVQKVRNDILAEHGFPSGSSGNVPELYGCLGPYYYLGTYNLNRQKFFKSPCGIVPMATSQGSHIGYSQVKVTQQGNGYDIYEYYVPINYGVIYNDVSYREIDPYGCNPNIPNVPAAPLPFDFQRGKLKTERHFKETGGEINGITYYYYYDSDKVTTPAYISRDELTAALTTRYELKSYWLTQTKTSETYFSSDGTAITKTNTTDYNSSYHHQPTKQTFIDSKGGTNESIMKYAFDFRIANCDAISDGWSSYQSALNACIAARNTAMSTATTQGEAFVASEDSFVCAAAARANYATNRKNNFTKPGNAFQTAHNNAKSSANGDLKPILEMQDDYMNPVIETTSWKAGNLTGAQFSKYAIASDGNVYLNKVQKVNLVSPSSSFTASTVNGTGLTKDNRYLDEATINYRSGNIHDVTPKTNATTIYIWDYLNNLPVAQITSVSASDTVAYTSFEADGTGGWTIASNTRYKNSAFTGDQSYNLLAGSITKHISSSVNYTLSFWSKGEPSVTGATKVSAGNSNFQDFTYYEYLTNKSATSVTINASGKNLLIDELRLYPVSAQMTTYTYHPLVGLTSQCDVNNIVTYYEYDGLGRLAHVRDQDNNIIKKYCYNYVGQSTSCTLAYTNKMLTQTFVKNDCTSTDYGGSEVTDSVMAGVYSSDKSQEAADSLATSYLNANGQSLANSNGACLPRLNIILNNYEHVSGFIIKFTSVYDSTLIYTVAIPANSNNSLSLEKIPQGRYNINISNPGNTNSYLFTVSGPAGAIQVNSDQGNWVNVPVNGNSFNNIAIGVLQQ